MKKGGYTSFFSRIQKSAMIHHTFARFPLSESLLGTLSDVGFSVPTPIQSAAIPLIFKQHDLLAKAKTGSGKTAAFALPLLAQITPGEPLPKALILCPTRELADQVAGTFRTLGRSLANLRVLTLTGGTPARPQSESLQRGADILVGTPGRVAMQIREGHLNPAKITYLVLDEGDRLLDMGFGDEVGGIIRQLPKKRQTLIFSATIPPEIETLSRTIQHNPRTVFLEESHDDTVIRQGLLSTREKEKALTALLHDRQPQRALIFCRMKETARNAASFLQEQTISALALHGDLDQQQRSEELVAFDNGTATVLVATDLAARGLQIDGVDLVVSFDVADSAEIHRHRIGRTGRAGATGEAITLAEPSDKQRLAEIEKENALPEIARPDPKTVLAPSPWRTLCIRGGRKEKLRPGDIAGALMAGAKIPKEAVGKITVAERYSYAAVHKINLLEHAIVHADQIRKAVAFLGKETIKNRRFRAWELDFGSV